MTALRAPLASVLLASALLVACSASADDSSPDWDEVGQRAATILSEYVRIDTQNPPGRTVEAADFLERLLQRAGLTTERVAANPDKPFLIGRLRGRGTFAKPIVLLNHMDVVPADPSKWSFPPLSGETHDGVLYGRGTVDMKGFGVAELMALELLARGERPQHDVVFLAVPDEEVGGSEGVEWLSQHRHDLMDVDAVWDEGGFGLSDGFAHPIFFTAVTEKQVLWLRVVAQGRAGHGSRPFADSAPLRLHQALDVILANPPQPRLSAVTAETFRRAGGVVPGARGFALRHLGNPLLWPLAKGALSSDPLTSASTRDTIALTMLDAGYTPNVIPERATAVLDCRLLPDTDPKAFIDSLNRLIRDDSVSIEIIQESRTAPVSPTTHPLFKAIEAAVTEVFPNSVATPFMSIAGTDSRFFRLRGVPAYGLIPIVLPRQLLATAHGIDERIPIASLGPAVRVVYQALRKL